MVYTLDDFFAAPAAHLAAAVFFAVPRDMMVLLTALLLFGALVALLAGTRPAWAFAPDGSPKAWGARTDERTSIFAPAVALPLAAILCFYLAAILDLRLR